MLISFIRLFRQHMVNFLFLFPLLMLFTIPKMFGQKTQPPSRPVPARVSKKPVVTAKQISSAASSEGLSVKSSTESAVEKKWNNTLSASVLIDAGTGTQTLTIGKDGALQLSELPEVLTIQLPEKDGEGLSVVFNKDKSSFTLSTNLKDSTAREDGSVPLLHPSDLRFGQLNLYFHEGELIRIGDRYIVARPKVDKTKPYIKINLPAIKQPEAALPKKIKQKLLPDGDTLAIAALQKCILCYVPPRCDTPGACDPSNNAKMDFNEKRMTGINSHRKRAEKNDSGNDSNSLANNWLSKIKERYRPVSVIDWNQDNNEQKHYLLYSDGRMVPVIDIRRRQKMQSWIIVRVTSQDSTAPKLTVDGLVSSEFVPTEAQLKALDNLGQSSGGGTTATPKKGDSAANKTAEDTFSVTRPAVAKIVSLEPGRKTDNIVMGLVSKFPELKSLDSNTVLTAFYIRAVETVEEVALNKTAAYLSTVVKNPQAIYPKIDSLYKLAKRLVQTMDEKQPATNSPNTSVDEITVDFNTEWKIKLIALDQALEEFNKYYASIDFRTAEYNRKLTDLKQGMKHCLGIAIADNADDFKKSLVRIVNDGADPANADELMDYVNIIAVEYKKVISKTSSRSIKYLYAQVPDADQFTLKLATDKPTKNIFSHTFAVVGGFKIDISTGPFYSGLRSSTYTLSQSKFSYADSRDTFFRRPSGEVIDSLIYTGKLNDTSGYFIKTNRNRLSYGIGFYAHGYWRSGGAVNGSLTMGFVLNNDGQAFGMLGLSALFANLKNRLVITAGGCVGKVKTISSSVNSYEYRSEYAPFENGKQVYLNRRDVPRFYNNPVTTEIPIYDKFKISYFVAMSFNLGSVKQ